MSDPKRKFAKLLTGVEFTSELYAEARKAGTNVIVAIGFLGSMKCYLNEDYDHIVSDFNADKNYDGSIDEYNVVITSLNPGETFEVYEILV